MTDDGMELTAALPAVTARATVISPSAVPLRVTVPVLLCPATMLAGEKLHALGEFAVTVRFAVFVPPLGVAETVTVVFTETFTVVIVNVAEFTPASTFTDAGIEPTAELPAVTARVTVVSL